MLALNISEYKNNTLMSVSFRVRLLSNCKQKNMKWERFKPPLRITGPILLSANLSNWEAKKLFEWDYLRKPIFLGIFVNHFKLHNNNMISLKK